MYVMSVFAELALKVNVLQALLGPNNIILQIIFYLLNNDWPDQFQVYKKTILPNILQALGVSVAITIKTNDSRSMLDIPSFLLKILENF